MPIVEQGRWEGQFISVGSILILANMERNGARPNLLMNLSPFRVPRYQLLIGFKRSTTEFNGPSDQKSILRSRGVGRWLDERTFIGSLWSRSFPETQIC